ncbi:MAG: efflux RND transporter periplasmic adaptor subunit [Bacteroidetes bacterium]|nr:efflux RND transporter periplasmic adaptor subunit [Bacteroidota bacterium]
MSLTLNRSLGILLSIASVTLTHCSGDKKESESKKENPILVYEGTPSQQAAVQISVSGQIESKETAAISTRIMGFVSSVKVKPGDHVQRGQLLISISNGDILAKRAQAQAMVSEAEAALNDAQKDYERYEELYKKQSASAKELENATLRYTSVKAKAEAARQMKNEADAMLAYTNLVAPFSGVVTQKNIDEGSIANPGMPLLMLAEDGDYHVRAAVSEGDIGKLALGTSATVTVKSTGKSFAGKVSEISPSSQFTGGQFQIKVTVPAEEKPGLFTGMVVNLRIASENKGEDQSSWVPASAIVYKDQLTGLYTIGENQTAQLRWVKVGKKQVDRVEILSGISAAEKFILRSEGKLFSGASVVVK